MRLLDFWNDQDPWNKIGICFVVATAVIAIVAVVRYDIF